MSTRAIIGIRTTNGAILGAWQWCDGEGMAPMLNKHFPTEEKAMQLINQGMWSTMFTADEKEEYENWLVNDLCKGDASRVSYHSYTEICGMHLLRHEHHENRPPEIYPNLEDALGQDINFLYLFDRESGEWEVWA